MMKAEQLQKLLDGIKEGDPQALLYVSQYISYDPATENSIYDALEEAAESGNAIFAEYLGCAYSFQFGAPRQGDAIKYLEIAAKAHRPWAEYKLYQIYKKKADRYLKCAVEDRCPTASLDYLHSLADVKTNPEAAFQLATDIVAGLNEKSFCEKTYWYNIFLPDAPEATRDIEELSRAGVNDSKNEAIKYAKIAAEANVPGADLLLESLL